MPPRIVPGAIPFVLVHVLVALVDLAIARAAWRRRGYPGALNLMVLMGAFAVWALGHAGELGAASLAGKVLWAKVQYAGIVLVPVAWVQLALQYVQGKSRLGKVVHNVLLAVPIAALLLAWSNELHHTFWRALSLQPAGPITVLEVTYGPAFWILIIYSYTLSICGSVLLARAALRTWSLFRWQATMLVVAALIPCISNVAYMTGHVPWGVDPTPFASMITGVLLLVPLNRLRLFDVAPIARNAILEQIEDGLFVLDTRDRVIDANAVARDLAERPMAVLLGHPAPEALAALPELASKIAQEKGPFEAEIQHGDTPTRIYHLRCNMLFDERATPKGRLIVLHDVTEQKRSEERYRDLLATAQRQTMEMSLLGQVRTAMARELEMAPLLRGIVETVAQSLGYTQVSLYLLQGDTLILQHQVGYAHIIRYIAITSGIAGRTARTGQAQFIPDVRQDPDFIGAIEGIVSEICMPLYDREMVAGIINIESCQGARLTDADLRLMQSVAMQAGMVITKARLYAEVRQSEARYRSLVEASPDLIALLDLEGKVVMANEQMKTLMGIPPSEAVGVDGFSLVAPNQRPQAQRAFRAAIAGENLPRNAEYTLWRPDGADIIVEISTAQVTDAGGNPSGLIAIVHDVSERHRAAQALKQAHEELEERVAQRTAELQAATEKIQQEATERLRLEEELRQAQKMEAIGRLAGGVAHDFNNLLTVINGYSEDIAAGLPEDDPRAADMQEILQAGHKAADLTRQLLAFSRRQVMAPRIIDLNEMIASSTKMLRRLIGEDVQLVLDLAPALGAILADPTQIEQVLLNLSLNARDAMPQGGTLTLKTSETRLNKASAARLSVPPGEYVRLDVGDTGIGLSDQVLEHLFEPFFTTKEKGKGTGLGLSTVYGIVRQSEGAIAVESHSLAANGDGAGTGTTFSIWLPRRAAREPQQRRAAAAPRTGQERILVVEDQAEVRRLAGRMLRQLGYAVAEAGGGAEALELLRKGPDPVNLVLTDVIMPGLSGRQLMDEIARVQQPVPRILLMSGYTDDSILRHGVEEGMPFVQKPFTMEELARKVREVLDSPA